MKKYFPFLGRFAVLFLLMLVGVCGFMIIEKFNFLDALYMTVITLATIGYHEVQPLSEAGKIFNIIFIIISVLGFAYTISSITRYIVSGEMAKHFKNQKSMNAIEKFSNHVILCGFGRHGQEAAGILLANKKEFVVIDTELRLIQEGLNQKQDLVFIHGDVTDDEVLIKAGIKRAKVLILTMPDDADNVFTVLSARPLNPDLIIISRAQLKSTVVKLKTAGADHVVLPELIGGAYMAALISKPDVIEFVNNLWGDQEESINIEALAYEDLPDAVKDKSIDDIINWYNVGASCLGIKDANGKFVMNPSKQTIISIDMQVMLFGSMQQIENLQLRIKNG